MFVYSSPLFFVLVFQIWLQESFRDVFVMHYNQQPNNLLLAWHDFQPVCTVNVFHLQVLALYKKILS